MYTPCKSLLVVLAAMTLANAQSLSEVLAGNDDLSTLTTLVTQLDLVDILEAGSGKTILAPSNDALAAVLGDTNLDDVTATTQINGTSILDILQYHVANMSGIMAPMFSEGTGDFVPTLLAAGNGDSDDADGSAQVVNVVRNGDDVTVYSGGRAASQVTTADIEYDNGVVHIIDRVLTVPQAPSVVASANQDLSTLVMALMRADLVETLDEASNLTIFAPTNEAFEAAGINLDEVDEDTLTSILQYHVIGGGPVYYSSALSDGASVQTLEGSNATVSIDGDTVMVGNATVVVPNVLIENGVVHVIDQVLMPNMSGAGNGSGAGNDSAPGGSEAGGDGNAASTLMVSNYLAGMTVVAGLFIL